MFCTPLLVASPVTYTYTGNDYTGASSPYTTSMAITASFTFASALAPDTVYTDTTVPTPTAWSISDGVDNITNTSGDTLGLEIATNSVGGVEAWGFATSFTENIALVAILSGNDPTQVFGPPGGFPCDSATACDIVFAEAEMHTAFLAGVQGDPGTWMPAATVPEPSLTFFIAIGLLVIAGMALRRTPGQSSAQRLTYHVLSTTTERATP